MKVYIAGPIAGRVNGNREAFAQRAKELIAAGHELINPWDIPPGPHEGSCIGEPPLSFTTGMAAYSAPISRL